MHNGPTPGAPRSFCLTAPRQPNEATEQSSPTHIDPPVIDFLSTDIADAVAMAEIRGALGPTAQSVFKKACAAVPAAVAQLKRSERGRRALADFMALLANGGHGLDTKNWEALAALCHAQGNGDLS